MTDAYGRIIDYLRVSITDRCNLRCIYCMPESGVERYPHEQILSYEEILRLCRVLADLGIQKVKVTGGEPMARRDAVGFIRQLKALPGITQVTMTSNGILLNEHMDELVDAGLDAVNISLDTLDAAMFQHMTRGEGLQQTLSAIDRAAELKLPLKVNCVPIKGLNDGQLTALAELARDREIEVRFIELMPIGLGADFRMVHADDIIAMLEEEFGALIPFGGKLGNGPAVYYSIEGFKGRIGFISAMSHEFCGECNRLRLTSDGFLKPCLFSDAAMDVKGMLRSGVTDDELKKAAQDFIVLKPRRHDFGSKEAKAEEREMFRIGG